ncbi:MAG: hypothetical protein K6T65_14235 [Peptococcaceae bacterium]|nr:hypothetical protein [Peptococcaceae bacterium]
MNDIWALPSGEWVIYSDEENVIRDFMSLADLEIVTAYHGVLKKHRAMQFKFADNDHLLRYVCFVAGFEYSRAARLLRRPGTSYNHSFSGSTYQPPLFVEVYPRRKKKK